MLSAVPDELRVLAVDNRRRVRADAEPKGETLRAKLKLPRQSFRHAWGVVLVLALAFPAAAQTSSSQTTQTLTAAAEQVADPLGRNTPRGTITGFNLAVHRNDFVSAARYMQVSAEQRASTEALARDLTELMDRYYTQLVTAVSALPEGALNDGLPPIVSGSDHSRWGEELGHRTGARQ